MITGCAGGAKGCNTGVDGCRHTATTIFYAVKLQIKRESCHSRSMREGEAKIWTQKGAHRNDAPPVRFE